MPSGCFKAKSAIVRTIPHPFARLTLFCEAKSRGFEVWVPRMTWREASRGVARETHLIGREGGELLTGTGTSRKKGTNLTRS